MCSKCHNVSYLDTAPAGLPSGTARTQCTVYLQSLDGSGTGLWTVEDRERHSGKDWKKKQEFTLKVIRVHFCIFHFQAFRGLCASSPCCSDFPLRAVGHSHRTHSLAAVRSSSDWEYTGHSCGPSHSPCKGRHQSAGHSDTVHHHKQTVWCQQSHRYSLRRDREETVWLTSVSTCSTALADVQTQLMLLKNNLRHTF